MLLPQPIGPDKEPLMKWQPIPLQLSLVNRQQPRYGSCLPSGWSQVLSSAGSQQCCTDQPLFPSTLSHTHFLFITFQTDLHAFHLKVTKTRMTRQRMAGIYLHNHLGRVALCPCDVFGCDHLSHSDRWVWASEIPATWKGRSG